MAQHARALAAAQRTTDSRGPNRLLARAADNAAAIASACTAFEAALKAGAAISQAATCLLGNAPLVEEQLRLARRDLPRTTCQRLPQLADDVGIPRAYQLVLELVKHADGAIDQRPIAGFVAAYQEAQVLGLGELRALPALLRLALVDYLHGIAAAMARDLQQRRSADAWADRLTGDAGRSPANRIVLVADMARSNPPLTRAFVAALARRLQGNDAPLAMQWLASQVAEAGASVEQLVQDEVAQQAADLVSVDNAVASLRRLGAFDWNQLTESLSPIEHALRRDPDGTYPRMDAATRSLYRSKVEALARKGALPELQVVEAALALAREPREPSAGGLDPRLRHVGHYLIGDGAQALEQRLGMAPRGPLRRILHVRGQARLLAFLGAIFTFTALFTAAALDRALDSAMDELLASVFTLVFAVGASQLAVALVHFIATQLTGPRILPRLDFAGGVPADAQALVTVPAMLYTPSDVHALCDALEVRYLANRDPNLRFCLLTDFADADAQHVPGDDELLALARERIDALNRRHASERVIEEPDEDGAMVLRTRVVEPFLLLHRARSWNARDAIWMGHERKRGKLAALNAFLRGRGRDSFQMVAGDVQHLHEVRYVITVDVDTQLPRDAARKLVATMAHPLNHAQVSAQGTHVASGYGVLQPRMSVSLPSEPASRYADLAGGGPETDPSGRTVSDVYQDLFAEGSFAGKGIYDVDAFERVLAGRMPENVLLSHDLLEGCYLRAGALSDQQLFEPYPSRYSVDVSRRHRWVRGDWQVAGWLRATVRAPDGRRVPNPLTPLSRWKIFDRLRASLVAPAFTTLLLMSWVVLPVDWFWTAAVLAALFVPPLLSMLFNLIEKPRGVPWTQHASIVWHSAAMSIGHAGLSLLFLPYQAFMNVDAIVRTGWRMLVSRRRLLEWRPSSLSRSSTNLNSIARNMWFAPLLAVVCAVVLQLSNPGALLLAGPFLLAWLLSPLVAWWVSLPAPRAASRLAPDETNFLHKLARRNWAYFEASVTPQGNWLPPEPVPGQEAMHGTSPSGIGLALLSNLAAWDFGYITTRQLASRCAGTLGTVARLERFQGHLFSCYDALTLQALPSRHVSTTASGTLAAHLLTLAQGLEQAIDAPLVDVRAFQGIGTTLDLVDEHARSAAPELHDAIAAMRAELARGGATAGAHTLPGLVGRFANLCRCADAIVAVEEGSELACWIERLRAQCTCFLDELAAMAPWSTRADQYVLDSRLTRVPTLRELSTFTLPGQPGDGTGALSRLVDEARAHALERIAQLQSLAQEASAAARMDFRFLYKEDTRLLYTGYNLGERRLDSTYVDQLASEARLASFVAIAQEQLPAQHWFALRRQLRFVPRRQWQAGQGGTLADYLMPLLVMPGFRGTLMDHSCRAAVRVLAESRRRRDLPWGLPGSRNSNQSEAMSEQYLVLITEPEQAVRNLQRLSGTGSVGSDGLPGSAADTPAQPPQHAGNGGMHAFIAQHHGIGLLALDYLLSGQPMQRRFAATPQLKATLPLLQERVPIAGEWHAARTVAPLPVHPEAPSPRMVSRTVTATPQVHLMSNGRFHVMVSSAGGGYAHGHGLAITRWRRDGTRDNWGSFCYVRDVDTGKVWSTTYQPTLVQPDGYEVAFEEGQASFRRHDNGIDLHTTMAVSPEDDVEVRRTRVINQSGARRELELTSYVAAAELFSHADILASQHAILFANAAAGGPLLLHRAHVHGDADADISFETRRGVFIGRGHDTSLPQAVQTGGRLAGVSGAVPDPVAAIRVRLVLGPGEAVTIDYVTGAAPERDAALRLVDEYRGEPMVDRAFALAVAHGRALLGQLEADDRAAHTAAVLAGSIIYPAAALRADPSTLQRNQRGQSALKAYGITGDLPVVLVVLRGPDGIALARQVMQAHAYWRLKGLQVDLMVWCEDPGTGGQALRDQVTGMAASSAGGQGGNRPGGIFVRAAGQIPPDDQLLMLSAACVVIDEAAGPLAVQVARAAGESRAEGALPPMPDTDMRAHPEPPLAMPELQMASGAGGFTMDGREYVIHGAPGQSTPSPWTNLLANPGFGSTVTESGQASTWSTEAHGAYLTSCLDDTVSDTSGEAFYIRDEQSGRFWSPGALPATGSGDYLARHGFGYSVFEHAQDGIHSEMTTYVAPDAPLKYSVIRVRNDSARLRRLSVTGYVEWVLGDLRDTNAMHIVTELDTTSGALFARNPFNEGLAGRVGFFHVNAQIRTVTCDRVEFIGRNRSLASPAAMQRRRLSGRTGAALDPCAAFCAPFALRPGEQRELVFVLGVGGRRTADAAHLIETCGGSDAARRALDKLREHWDRVLGAIRVSTPDPALDLMVNGWLAYQAIATGMHHTGAATRGGGACRDGLLDALAALGTQPQLLRRQLLLCAGHLPAQARDLRLAEDRLLLSYATARYVAATGDDDVLGEYIRNDADGNGGPATSLYEHCAKAVRQLLDVEGRGYGGNACARWFQAEVLSRFGDLAEREGDQALAGRCRERTGQMAGQGADHDLPFEEDSADARMPFWTALALAHGGDAEHAWEILRQHNPADPEAARERTVIPACAPYAFAPGAAGLMHWLAVECLLGLQLQEGALKLAPLLPMRWPGFTVHYRHGASPYLIDIQRGERSSLKLDGRPVEGSTIPLHDDGMEHRVEVRVGPASRTVS